MMLFSSKLLGQVTKSKRRHLHTW